MSLPNQAPIQPAELSKPAVVTEAVRTAFLALHAELDDGTVSDRPAPETGKTLLYSVVHGDVHATIFDVGDGLRPALTVRNFRPTTGGTTRIQLVLGETGSDIETEVSVADSRGRAKQVTEAVDPSDRVNLEATVPEAYLGELATEYLREAVLSPDTLRQDPESPIANMVARIAAE